MLDKKQINLGNIKDITIINICEIILKSLLSYINNYINFMRFIII